MNSSTSDNSFLDHLCSGSKILPPACPAAAAARQAAIIRLVSLAPTQTEMPIVLGPSSCEYPGTASVAEVTETSARVELREIWNFGNSYQVGVFEGAMKHFGVRGSVQGVRVGRRCDVDLIMHWET